LRMKGRILASLPQPKPDEAEICFVEALELSRRNGAKAWELRAAIDLAGLLADEKKAKQLLQSALGGFVAGSDTEDIRVARKMLA
jgi:hypothetical protein